MDSYALVYGDTFTAGTGAGSDATQAPGADLPPGPGAMGLAAGGSGEGTVFDRTMDAEDELICV